MAVGEVAVSRHDWAALKEQVAETVSTHPRLVAIAFFLVFTWDVTVTLAFR